MAAFRFSLQPLLEFKASVEDARRRSLFEAERAFVLERERLDALEAQLGRLGEPFRSEALRPAAWDARRALLEIDLVKAALAKQQRGTSSCRDALERVRQEFIAARDERVRLESLRARKYEAFLVEEERREAAGHDDANAERGTISP